MRGSLSSISMRTSSLGVRLTSSGKGKRGNRGGGLERRTRAGPIRVPNLSPPRCGEFQLHLQPCEGLVQGGPKPRSLLGWGIKAAPPLLSHAAPTQPSSIKGERKSPHPSPSRQQQPPSPSSRRGGRCCPRGHCHRHLLQPGGRGAGGTQGTWASPPPSKGAAAFLVLCLLVLSKRGKTEAVGRPLPGSPKAPPTKTGHAAVSKGLQEG